jgi:hypothetical protein
MRLMIYVTPARLLWWPHGDFGQEPLQVEAPHGPHESQGH